MTNGSNLSAKDLRGCIAESLADLVKVPSKNRKREMQRYLEAQARFHSYSPNNVLLILAQRPEARRVAGYKRWQRMGFQVGADEKAIRILAPQDFKKKVVDPATGKPVLDPESGEPKVEEGVYFKAVCVYDVDQVGIPCFVCGHVSKSDAERCEGCGEELDARLPEAKWKGGQHEATRRVRKMVEENIEANRGSNGGAPREVPKEMSEVEACAAAYVVCAHFGLAAEVPDCSEIWDRKGAVLQERLKRVADAAHAVIEQVESQGKATIETS